MVHFHSLKIIITFDQLERNIEVKQRQIPDGEKNGH